MTIIYAALVLLLCSASTTTMAASEKRPDFSIFKGKWGRTDGPYVIQIGDIDPEGKIDVKYLNPKEINISEVNVSVQKGLLKLFIKLQDEGYPGSTYTLYYYKEKDALAGFYYQAAIKETFEVIFLRNERNIN